MVRSVTYRCFQRNDGPQRVRDQGQVPAFESGYTRIYQGKIRREKARDFLLI